MENIQIHGFGCKRLEQGKTSPFYFLENCLKLISKYRYRSLKIYKFSFSHFACVVGLQNWLLLNLLTIHFLINRCMAWMHLNLANSLQIRDPSYPFSCSLLKTETDKVTDWRTRPVDHVATSDQWEAVRHETLDFLHGMWRAHVTNAPTRETWVLRRRTRHVRRLREGGGEQETRWTTRLRHPSQPQQLTFIFIYSPASLSLVGKPGQR